MRRQEKFLYLCDTLDLWEWELRVLDVQEGTAGEENPVCVEGRGAMPPENCGGPRGYRLMLKRQEAGPGVSDPAAIEAAMKTLAEAYGDEPEIDWQLFEEAVNSGWKNVEERLERSGPLTPACFS